MSKKYQVAAVPGGFAVGALSGAGFLVAVEDHATRDSAEHSAARMNRQWEALQRAELARAIERRRRHTFGRRLVRYFENETETA